MIYVSHIKGVNTTFCIHLDHFAELCFYFDMKVFFFFF